MSEGWTRCAPDAPGGEYAPEICIICVEPQKLGWWASLCQGLKGPFLKFLSDGITWADNGRYSHNALKRGDRFIDSQLGERVAGRPYSKLDGLPRELAYYVYADGESDELLCRVWDAIASFGSDDQPRARRNRPLSDEEPRFSLLGLFRLGVILLQRGEDRQPKKWWLERRKDSKGVFCSELIAKGFVAAGVPLRLCIEPSRIPPPGPNRELMIDLMVARYRATDGGASTASTQPPRDLFEAQLNRITNASVDDEGCCEVLVGYDDIGGGQDELLLFPPVFVTPNDLARAPSLRFVGAEDGRTGSKCGTIPADRHDELDDNLREARGRATRLILRLAKYVLAVIIGLLMVGFVAFICGWRPKIGLGNPRVLVVLGAIAAPLTFCVVIQPLARKLKTGSQQ